MSQPRKNNEQKPASDANQAPCACGRVVFDLRDRKAGAGLRCPACERRWLLKEIPAPNQGASTRILVPARLKKKSVALTPDNPSKNKPPETAADGTAADEGVMDVEIHEMLSDPEEPEEEPQSQNKEKKASSSRKQAAEPRSTRTTQRETRDLTKTSRVTTRRHAERATDRLYREKLEEVPELRVPFYRRLTPERIVAVTAILIMPAVLISFVASLILDVVTGKRRLESHAIFGFVLRANDWRVWVGAAFLGAVAFFLLWMAYVFVFVHLQKKKEKPKRASGEENNDVSARQRESKRRSKHSERR